MGNEYNEAVEGALSIYRTLRNTLSEEQKRQLADLLSVRARIEKMNNKRFYKAGYSAKLKI